MHKDLEIARIQANMEIEIVTMVARVDIEIDDE